MKKSRTGLAILLLAFLVIGFVIVALLVSFVIKDSDDDGEGLAGLFSSRNQIAVIPVEDTLTASNPVLKQLRKYAKKSSVRAIILRINSPGGAVAPAQEIYAEITKAREKKPVVASIETVGASAAYYIASNADRIVCSRGSVTGSIGVIMLLPELREVFERLGVNVNVIKAGKYKDIGLSVRPLTEEERRILESFAEEIHEQFIQDVAAGRKGKIELEKLREIANGSFFTGEKAKELGLVDEIGNFYDAVRVAKKLGGIKGDVELVYPEKKWDSYLDLFLQSLAQALSRAIEKSSVMQPAPLVR